MEDMKSPTELTKWVHAVKGVSGRAYLFSFGLLGLISEDKILAPDVAVGGEGDVYLEWELDKKFVSARIYESNPEYDRIYVESGDSYGSVELNMENLLKELGVK